MSMRSTKRSPESIAGDWIKNSRASLREIEQSTGISRSKLANLKKGQGRLSVRDLLDLAEALGRSTQEALLPRDRARPQPPRTPDLGRAVGSALVAHIQSSLPSVPQAVSIEDVCAWHEITQGRLHLASTVRPYLVAFRLNPTHPVGLMPVEVGQHSLVARKIIRFPGDHVSPRDVEDFLLDLPENQRHSLTESYADLQLDARRRYIERQLVFFAGDGSPTVTTYLTVLMTGRWADESEVIWNFSTELSSRKATEAEVDELRSQLGFR